ncbi:CKLF-like MARVEL transmembrane domain-containing protein 7 isoform 2-T2 [Leptodactylus fuscus]|uniref:CKLF-like MARVEL transmembrane domain-containing protein 7 isoform X2 n=1 Tax=Leptodactylus fuscus TaxID=238119 RepID=UPI003F4EAC8E
MSQHNVTVIRTTASSSNVQPSSPGLIDKGYPRTTGASLKLCQALCLLIAFLCVRFSRWTDYSAYRYFEVITMCFMILILILYVVNLFRIYRMLTCVSWPLTVGIAALCCVHLLAPCWLHCSCCEKLRHWRISSWIGLRIHCFFPLYRGHGAILQSDICNSI